MRTDRIVRHTLWLAVLACAACNPTWTKEGRPNDSSMPVPPGANAPVQAGTNGTGTQSPSAKP